MPAEEAAANGSEAKLPVEIEEEFVGWLLIALANGSAKLLVCEGFNFIGYAFATGAVEKGSWLKLVVDLLAKEKLLANCCCLELATPEKSSFWTAGKLAA